MVKVNILQKITKKQDVGEISKKPTNTKSQDCCKIVFGCPN